MRLFGLRPLDATLDSAMSIKELQPLFASEADDVTFPSGSVYEVRLLSAGQDQRVASPFPLQKIGKSTDQ